MNDDGADISQPNPALADDELMGHLAGMLAEENTPPPLVMELARQSFGLRAVDAELAALTADSDVIGTAASVRRTFQPGGPRLLTFASPALVVELEVNGSAADRRIFGELTPPGVAMIEVRQPDSPAPRLVDADEDGRFVIEDLLLKPLSLICHRLGHSPVTTEWTSLS
jgi:hypothetical protein